MKNCMRHLAPNTSSSFGDTHNTDAIFVEHARSQNVGIFMSNFNQAHRLPRVKRHC